MMIQKPSQQQTTKSNLWQPGIYGILGNAPKSILLKKAEAALNAGLAVLQYRENEMIGDEKEAIARALLTLCQRYQRPFVINNDVALAAKIGADGVHLGQTDTSLLQAKTILPAHVHIGVTCHDQISLAEKAKIEGANYVAFGAFFNSSTKSNASRCALSVLELACKVITLPITVIGGITCDNLHYFKELPIAYVAVSAAIFETDKVFENTQNINQLFSQLRSH